MSQNGKKVPDGCKRILVVGAGAAGMSTAYHLSQHPEKFDVTLIDAVDYCGGQAFSIPLDKSHHGASWCNQGVQGGSYIFHHTLTMFARQGYHADPVELQVSFGKNETFWTNMFPTQLILRHQKEVARLAILLKLMRWFGILFALLPLRFVFKLFMFSDEFTDTVALPMTALFLGTGNATPEVPAIMFERLCMSPTYGMWYKPDKNMVVSNRPPMVVFPNLSEFYETWREDLVSRGVSVHLSTELAEVVQRGKGGVVVRLKPRTPVPGGHNPKDADLDAPTSEETFDEIVLCCLADKAKEVLGKTASWREKRVLGSFNQHVFQTIYLNKDRDRHLWSDGEIRKDRIIRQDWWHQLCHSYTHYLFVVPWMMFLQARKHTRFAAAWTLVNAHEVAIMSGIAAAVDLGADYPEDLERDRFSLLCFRLYYLLVYGKWYRRRHTAGDKKPDADRSSWATGLHGSMYKGPGVSAVERQTWRDEVKKGTSTENLAKGNAPGRSQP